MLANIYIYIKKTKHVASSEMKVPREAIKWKLHNAETQPGVSKGVQRH